MPVITGGSDGSGLVLIGKFIVVPSPKVWLPPPMPTATLEGIPTLQAQSRIKVSRETDMNFMAFFRKCDFFIIKLFGCLANRVGLHVGNVFLVAVNANWLSVV